MKKSLSLFCCILSLAWLSACAAQEPRAASEKTGGKLKVVATFEAIAQFAKAVGGDRIELQTLVPSGTEPHEYEPKAKDLEAISNADLFVYNGLGMESWAEKSLQAIGSKTMVSVDTSSGCEPIPVSDEAQKADPHLWLSLKGAELQAGNIKDALIRADPHGKEAYEANYKAFYDALEALYQTYSEKLNAASAKYFVTGHAAFGYLCRDFGLTQKSVEDVFAEGEPSAKQLIALADFCRENKIGTIFVENMVSPAVSETLAAEVGARTVKIYTDESAEDGLTYLECMEYNLDAICQSVQQ